ncbi:MAG TPA: hypothetical protein VMT52_12025, partial [Planctomycetota bacterium]|nr:hypothetical protein [Planctomycetota bacterium]
KGFGSLKRSRELARGAWSKIFIVYSIATFIVLLPFSALRVGTWLTIPGADTLTPGPGVQPLLMALDVLLSSLTSPFAIGATTLLYYDQRVRKEGLDVELEAAAIEDAPGAAGPLLPPAAL